MPPGTHAESAGLLSVTLPRTRYWDLLARCNLAYELRPVVSVRVGTGFDMRRRERPEASIAGGHCPNCWSAQPSSTHLQISQGVDSI